MLAPSSLPAMVDNAIPEFVPAGSALATYLRHARPVASSAEYRYGADLFDHAPKCAAGTATGLAFLAYRIGLHLALSVPPVPVPDWRPAR